MANKVSVTIWKGDLCAFKVDAIVNAANESLSHMGGLAKALSATGGRTIQAESDVFIAKNGKLKAGQVAVTTAGKLPCMKLIHLVGPCLQNDPTVHMISHAKKLLTKGILNVMTCAEEHKFSSVAIPAVSSGIFNFPVSICADVVVTTIKKYIEHKNPTSPPFEIHLVNNDDPAVKEMERAFKEIPLEPLSDVMRTGPEDSPSTLERTEHLERNTAGLTKDTASQVAYLWKQQEAEVVVSVVPSQIRGNNFVIRHSAFLTLRPHSWLVGEVCNPGINPPAQKVLDKVIESLLHHWAIRLNLGNNIYIMNHYTSGVILYGEREN
ncbi:protein mono-ADP-ribosyltransferase PARP9-like [Oreochromis aureus]|uniref:protein mono-ADP-ribosyltransferase PARP9-like n=1 Tax=Oreochromis aureus TaxID=47969 RepID=UPI00195397FC|nr:protein mono-ADP-ribosyltransferase PARP9-like [Oreochromis aureus]